MGGGVPSPRAPGRGSAIAPPRHRRASSGSDAVATAAVVAADHGDGDGDGDDDGGGDGDGDGDEPEDDDDGDGDETVDLQTFARALLSSDNDITGCRLKGMPRRAFNPTG